MSLRLRTLLALLVLALGAPAAVGLRPPAARADGPFTTTVGAVQTPYVHGGPHTEASGRARTTFDPTLSFFPIGIYHAVPCTVSQLITWTKQWEGGYRLLVALDPGATPDFDRQVLDKQVSGTSYTAYGLPADTPLYYNVFRTGYSTPFTSGSFQSQPCKAGSVADPSSVMANAGFNVALNWSGLHLSLLIDRLAAAGVRAVADFRHSTPASIAQFTADPRVFGWYMDDEPLMNARLNNIDPALPLNNLGFVCYVYCGRDDQIWFFTEWPLINDPFWPSFIGLAEAGSHDEYIRYSSTPSTLRPIADSMRLQTSILGQAKPSWFVAQAFGGNGYGVPTPKEMRGMVYTALIHGATGIYQFAWDSHVMRGVNMIGIRPNPETSYGSETWRPTSAQIVAANALWNSLDASQGGLNAELQALRPALLSPTATDTYSVAVSAHPISAAPVRTLLKKYGGHWYLLSVNMDNVSLDARLMFGRAVDGLQPQFESAPTATTTASTITDHFDPFEAHVYEFDLRCPDADGNGLISFNDALRIALAAAAGVSIGDPAYTAAKDANGDGFITFTDALIAAKMAAAGQGCG